MKYFKGYVSIPIENHLPSVTDKAICFTLAGGYTCANDTYVWIPKSQVKIGKANEVGNAEILIPYWLIKQKSLNPSGFFSRLREIILPECNCIVEQ